MRYVIATLYVCETPKSPPGDYNLHRPDFLTLNVDVRVKHLNPRQGITTRIDGAPLVNAPLIRVKHLNPRQGITTRNERA